MKKIRIIVCGFGNVGRAFVRLVNRKQGDLKQHYGIIVRIAAVVDIGGAAIAGSQGLTWERLQEFTDGQAAIETMASYGRPGVTGG